MRSLLEKELLPAASAGRGAFFIAGYCSPLVSRVALHDGIIGSLRWSCAHHTHWQEEEVWRLVGFV